MIDKQLSYDERPLSVRWYIAGFFAALFFTGIAFSAALWGDSLPRTALVLTIIAAGVFQVLVHLFFFLHLDMSPSGRMSLLALLFTLVILIIFAGGSIWVISDLNRRMM